MSLVALHCSSYGVGGAEQVATRARPGHTKHNNSSYFITPQTPDTRQRHAFVVSRPVILLVSSHGLRASVQKLDNELRDEVNLLSIGLKSENILRQHVTQ